MQVVEINMTRPAAFFALGGLLTAASVLAANKPVTVALMDAKGQPVGTAKISDANKGGVVILYGSLFPFHFHESPHPFRTLLESGQERVTRIDIVTNVLLYIPLGLF